MIAISGEVHDNDLRVGESLSDKALDIRSSHCHRVRSSRNDRCYAKSKPTRRCSTKRAGKARLSLIVALSAKSRHLFERKPPLRCRVSDTPNDRCCGSDQPRCVWSHISRRPLRGDPRYQPFPANFPAARLLLYRWNRPDCNEKWLNMRKI